MPLLLVGAIFQARAVLDFGDLMILGMAFPNLVGVMLLSGKIKAALDDYEARLRSGAILPVDEAGVEGAR